MIRDLDGYCEFLETIPDAAVLVDAKGDVVFANGRVESLLGHAPATLKGAPLTTLVPHAARSRHSAQVAEYFQHPRSRPMRTGRRFAALRADGSELPVDIMLQPLAVEGASLVLAVMRDVSERLDMEGQLQAALERERALAHTDPLTGAANRRTFDDVVGREIDRLRRYGHAFSLCYLDLDNFKAVNDRLGHSAGDELLRALVGTLRAHLRASDLLARLGGDEFAILLPETDRKGALATMHKMRHSVAELMREHGWPVTMSIGVLACHAAPPSIDTLVHAADVLMYHAKNEGKDRVVDGEYPAAPYG